MALSSININPTWQGFYNRNIKLIRRIEKQINPNSQIGAYYPNEDDVFRFMRTDFNKIKFVIMGMDPYYQYDLMKKKPVATGRCFEPSNYNDWRARTTNRSIVNILKAIYYVETNNDEININTIREEIRNGSFDILSPHEWFDSLESQGVLFLNFSLTVLKDTPGSHIEYWRPFTENLVKYIDSKLDVEWLLWGKFAREVNKILNIKTDIEVCHPRLASFVKDENNGFQKMKDSNIKLRGK